MTKDMEIAFLTELFPKISETFILNQVTGLLEAEHDVHIFADRPAGESKVHSEIEEFRLLQRTDYIRKPKTYSGVVSSIGSTAIRYPRSIPQLYESITRGKAGAARIANLQTFLGTKDADRFDVYHAHFGTVGNAWDFLNDEAVVGENVSETPFVVSFYGIDASHVITRDPDAYEMLFRATDCVTVLSEDMKSDLVDAGCPQRKIEIQPLGIDLSKFPFRERSLDPSEELKILTVARFDEQKGLRYAIEGIKPIADKHDITYYIAGDGPLFEEIEQKIKRLGLTDSVELLGLVNHDEVRKFYERSHLFLLPSVTAEDGRKEGTPTVLLEAQASGLPVVSTYHAGIPEIVEDGHSGILVPERDAGAVTDALESLISKPDMWAEMGHHGRKNIEENHSIPVVVRGLVETYKELNGVELNENTNLK